MKEEVPKHKLNDSGKNKRENFTFQTNTKRGKIAKDFQREQVPKGGEVFVARVVHIMPA